MRVIVTRPASQAGAWVRELQALGLDAVALPLITIAAPPDPAALMRAWAELAQRRLVVFVSPNAALRFFAARPAARLWPTGVLAASTGPGTTRALLAAGVPAAQIVEPAPESAQFDSEALWQRLVGRDWRGASVLIVRGDGGRDWLADTLQRAGATVAPLCAYQRAAPALDVAEAALLHAALAQAAQHVWCFSSSEAIANLGAIVSAGTDWGAARAIATHPRIAARARQLGFGSVVEARPQPTAVAACIQSFRT